MYPFSAAATEVPNSSRANWNWNWPRRWEFLLAYRVVGYLWKAQAAGRSLEAEEMLESGELAELIGVSQPEDVATGGAQPATQEPYQSPPMEIET